MLESMFDECFISDLSTLNYYFIDYILELKH